jgi:hypothetical protein
MYWGKAKKTAMADLQAENRNQDHGADAVQDFILKK